MVRLAGSPASVPICTLNRGHAARLRRRPRSRPAGIHGRDLRPSHRRFPRSGRSSTSRAVVYPPPTIATTASAMTRSSRAAIRRMAGPSAERVIVSPSSVVCAPGSPTRWSRSRMRSVTDGACSPIPPVKTRASTDARWVVAAADPGRGPSYEHLDRQHRGAVAPGFTLEQFGHVGGAADREEARSVVQVRLDGRRGQPGSEHAEDDPGVDRAGPGPHHQAFERGHPHGRVHRSSPIDRRHGAAAAEVRDDEREFVGRALQELRRPAHRPCHGQAVEAVASDA